MILGLEAHPSSTSALVLLEDLDNGDTDSVQNVPSIITAEGLIRHRTVLCRSVRSHAFQAEDHGRACPMGHHRALWERS